MNAVMPITTRSQTAIEVSPKDAAASQDAKPERSFWQRAFGDDGLSFSTLLDVVNPLQHIPVVSTIYREVTGDTIAPAAKLIGDTLFGGPIGLALSAVDVTIQGETGKDMGQHVVAMFKPSTPTDGETAIASAGDKTTVDAADATTADPSSPSNTTPSPSAPSAASSSEPTKSPEDSKPTEVAALTPKPAPAAEPAAYVARSAFVANAMKPRAPGNGIGGAFVPLESRSTIAQPSMFAPVSLGALAPREEAKKPVDKSATDLPDAKSVAANPDMLRSLRTNGARPAPTQNANRGPSVTVPMPPPVTSLAAPDSTGGTSGDVADVMARNLERYMALRNRRPAPTKIDSAL